MTEPSHTPTNRDAIEQAEALIAAHRALIDGSPHLSPETKRAAHQELDAALWKFMSALAREAGIPQ